MPRGRKKSTTTSTDTKEWDFTQFARAIGGMIQNPAWMNEILKQVSTQSAKKYTKEQIVEWLNNIKDHEHELLSVHQYLLYSSPHYNRLVDEIAKILTFDYILVPTTQDFSSTFERGYLKTLDWFEKFDVKYEFGKIMRTISGEDVGFYYLRDNGAKWTLQKLPTLYCKLISYDDMGYRYAFDLTFFEKQGINLDDYPVELVRAFKKFKNGKSSENSKWYVPGENGVAFKFNEWTSLIIPVWVGLFIDALDVQNYKELNITRQTLDNWKLLVQKIPMRDGKDAKVNDFLIDLDSAGKFHSGVKSNLPPGVSLSTTPMNIESINMEKRQSNETLVGVGEKNFYNASGTSSLLFNSEQSGSIGLEKSVQTDEMFVIHMYRQFERFINYWVAKLNKGKIKIYFPDITYFNRDKKGEQFLKYAQFGYPKSLVACTEGLTPGQFMNLNAWENKVGITEIMKPLQSSHTTTNEEGGKPKKEDGDLGDTGLKTKDGDKNNDRA